MPGSATSQHSWRRIRLRCRPNHEQTGAGGVDDPAPTRLPEFGDRVARAPEDAIHVDLEDSPPVRNIHVHDAALGGVDAGALLKRTSSLPNDWIVSSTNCRASSSLETSHFTKVASPPSSSIDRAVFWPSSTFTSPMLTGHPPGPERWSRPRRYRSHRPLRCRPYPLTSSVLLPPAVTKELAANH